MAKNGGGGWVVVVLLAALGIAYLSTGRGEQNSPLIPDSIEGKIDLVVKALNDHFGHQWVNYGLDALQSYLQRAFPQVAAFVYVVYEVEQLSKNNFNAMGGPAKQQLAAQMARQRQLT